MEDLRLTQIQLKDVECEFESYVRDNVQKEMTTRERELDLEREVGKTLCVQ